ncbi:hypothetical protein [Pseudonocardia sp.]|uniref:hypothetical protein n=1 Tax=Pseudonocardia sp. TaxID=60912 RepID=UPI003D11FC86
MHRSVPLLIAVLVAAVVFAAALLGRSTDAAPTGSTLTAQDRLALDAPAVVRGAPALPVDPAVDLGDPEAVARAYLIAALSLVADDTGRTHLRAAGYAEPGSPPATVGVLVLDPPPPGEVRRAAVRDLELVAAAPDDRRRAYLAAVETITGPPGGPGRNALVNGHLVLAFQPDGRWLVASDTAPDPDLDRLLEGESE